MPQLARKSKGRPIAVAIIAWVSIAMGLFFLVTYGLSGYLLVVTSSVQEVQNHAPGAFLGWSVSPTTFWALVLFVPFVLIIDGVFLLRGHNWARMLAVFWWTFSFLSLLYTYGPNAMTLVQTAFCLLVIYFLNTPPAVTYFKGKPAV